MELVRRWGRGVPICMDIDSHHGLAAGLEAWYASDPPVLPPLVRGTSSDPIDSILLLKRTFDFRVSVVLTRPKTDNGKPSLDWIEQAHDQALKVHHLATRNHGFRPGDILFECPGASLTSDIPEDDGTPSRTHIAFETLRRIRQDKNLKGVGCMLEAGPAAAKLPRAIGVCRAYIAKAMEYGVDTCLADAQRGYGLIPADPKILALVDAFANMDGSFEKRQHAGELLETFCQAGKKPRPKPQEDSPKVKVPIDATRAIPGANPQHLTNA